VLQTSQIDGHRTFTAMAATDVSAYAIKVKKDFARFWLRFTYATPGLVQKKYSADGCLRLRHPGEGRAAAFHALVVREAGSRGLPARAAGAMMLLSRGGRSPPGNASGCDTHRDTIIWMSGSTPARTSTLGTCWLRFTYVTGLFLPRNTVHVISTDLDPPPFLFVWSPAYLSSPNRFSPWRCGGATGSILPAPVPVGALQHRRSQDARRRRRRRRRRRPWSCRSSAAAARRPARRWGGRSAAAATAAPAASRGD
jgi:hypothetical protein